MVVSTDTVIAVTFTESAKGASSTGYALPRFAVDVSGQLIGKVVNREGANTSTFPQAWIAIETGLITRRLRMAPLDGCWVDGTDVVLPWSRGMVRRSPRIASGRSKWIAASAEQRLGEYYGSAHGADRCSPGLPR